MGDNGLERTDLIEMWAYFNGRDLTHRRYGANRHSRGSLFGTPSNFANSWFGFNETVIFDPQTQGQVGHIPGGFLQDIRDDNTYNVANGLGEAAGIRDEVHGFSKSAIFNLLGSGTTSAASLMDQLGNQLPSGNTQAAYTNLRAAMAIDIFNHLRPELLDAPLIRYL